MATPPVASTSQLNQLITYPKADPVPSNEAAAARTTPAPKIQVKERLYIGNLHPTVDECVFLSLLPLIVTSLALANFLSNYVLMMSLSLLPPVSG
jgi:hypothetical protein